MSNARFILVILAILGASVAVVGLSPIILVVAGLLWAWRRWRRPKAATTVLVPLEEVRHQWGYVIPFRAFTEWTPGYVGITDRAPRELADGALWCPRWDDTDHEEKRAAGLLDYARAEVLYVGDTRAKARAWEDATIAHYLTLGAPLLNEQGNPHR
jgi:hypothetical protein